MASPQRFEERKPNKPGSGDDARKTPVRTERLNFSDGSFSTAVPGTPPDSTTFLKESWKES